MVGELLSEQDNYLPLSSLSSSTTNNFNIYYY